MKGYDFKKEWPKVKKQLTQFSKEAMVVVKKGEKEIVRLSKEGKLRVDATSLGLKKEHLFYLIGKECVRTESKNIKNPKLKKLFGELKAINKQLRTLNLKIKTAKRKK